MLLILDFWHPKKDAIAVFLLVDSALFSYFLFAKVKESFKVTRFESRDKEKITTLLIQQWMKIMQRCLHQQVKSSKHSFVNKNIFKSS